MEVNYKTKINGGNIYDSYEILETKYCCKELKNLFLEGSYKFSEQDIFKLEPSHFKDIENTTLEFSIVEYNVEDNDFGPGYELHSYNHPIKYCPFCGTEIVLNEVKKVKVVRHVQKVPKTICEEIVTEEEVDF